MYCRFRTGSSRIPEGVYKKTADTAPDAVMSASPNNEVDRLIYYLRDSDYDFLAEDDRFGALDAQQVAYAAQAGCVQDVGISMGQTAYSNGTATDFLQELRRC